MAAYSKITSGERGRTCTCGEVWRRCLLVSKVEEAGALINLLHFSVCRGDCVMRHLSLVALALIAFLLPAFAQARHPFTFEDMMKLKRVGEPQVSPDGKWVIYTVVHVDLEANTNTREVWIVRLGGGGADALSARSQRILIPDQDGDRPRCAPG